MQIPSACKRCDSSSPCPLNPCERLSGHPLSRLLSEHGPTHPIFLSTPLFCALFFFFFVRWISVCSTTSCTRTSHWPGSAAASSPSAARRRRGVPLLSDAIGLRSYKICPSTSRTRWPRRTASSRCVVFSFPITRFSFAPPLKLATLYIYITQLIICILCDGVRR